MGVVEWWVDRHHAPYLDRLASSPNWIVEAPRAPVTAVLVVAMA